MKYLEVREHPRRFAHIKRADAIVTYCGRSLYLVGGTAAVPALAYACVDMPPPLCPECDHVCRDEIGTEAIDDLIDYLRTVLP